MTIKPAFTALLLAAAASLASPAAAEGDGRFTIAVIPDTQNYIDFRHQRDEGFPFDASALFLEQMAYIAAHTEAEGGQIAFVTSMGDTWQNQSLEIDPGHVMRGQRAVPNPHFWEPVRFSPRTLEFEMPMAQAGYRLIAGKVPFSVVPGNHDYDAMWTDSRFPPAEVFDPADIRTLGFQHPGGLSNFQAVFGEHSEFFAGQDWYVAANDGGADSAQVFEAEGWRFLHIGLQFDAPDSSLEWAAQVIAAHPGLPTIVSTHDYMHRSGARRPSRTVDGALVDPEGHNTPEQVWEKLISQHDQIFMVLCGHQSGQSFRVDDNAFGHPVYQILADYQGRWQSAKDAGVTDNNGSMDVGDGWMRFMDFDMTGETPRVAVRTYSTFYDADSREADNYAAWYREEEQPQMTDAQFHDADDFGFELTGFAARFSAARIMPEGED